MMQKMSNLDSMFPHYRFAEVGNMVVNTTLFRNPNKIPTGPLKGIVRNALFMGLSP